MHSPPYPKLLSVLLLGLALSAVGARWFLSVSRSAPTTPALAQTADVSSVPGGKSLVLPPRLDADEAGEALDAYLGLPPLDRSATAAEVAERKARLQALLSLLPDSSFPRLLTALATRAGAPEAALRNLAFTVWTERDAPAAAHWAVALVPDAVINAATRARYVSEAVLEWANFAFDAAYAWALALPDSALARELPRKLLAQLAATDPHRAIALAQARGDAFFATARESIFATWVKQDPAGAFQTLGAAVLETEANIWKYHPAITEWLERDNRAALAWISSKGPSEKLASGLSLFGSVVWPLTKDAKTASAVAGGLAEQADSPDRFQRFLDLLRAWKTQDPEAALIWLKSAPDLSRRADLIEQLLNISSTNSGRPESDLAFALCLPEGRNRDERVAEMVARWSAVNPDAALAWLRDHEDDPAVELVTARVESAAVAKLAATDPRAALQRWESLPKGSGKSSAALTIAEALSRTDPAAAARWFVEKIPATGQNHQAERLLQQLVEHWVHADGDAAVRWSESISDEQVRRTMLLAFTGNSNPGQNELRHDPADRAGLLAKISNPALRTDILSAHLKNWLRMDYRAARAWIESHDALPAAQAARLLDDAAPASRH